MAALKPIVVYVTAAGRDTARAAASILNADLAATDGVETIREAFLAGRPVVGVCAAGVLIRAVAPFLNEKRAEPPVIALAADGAAAVPLLGGHRGANALARQLADALGGSAAVTTASDVLHGVALDEPPPGWAMRPGDRGDAKSVAAAILEGGEVGVQGEGPWAERLAGALNTKPTPRGATAAQGQAVDQVTLSAARSDGVVDLHYAAQRYALGVGCARHCPADDLARLAEQALATLGLTPDHVAGVFSIDVKADEAAVHALGAAYTAPVRFFPAEALARIDAPNPSEVVRAEVGTGSVAEAAALLGAGEDATLVFEKQKTANATVAVARAPAPIVAPPGRPRGRLAVVGIGPGQASWRTPEASKLIAEAEELVGYGLYIDLLGPLAAAKPRADFPLGGEEARCRYALEEAAKGRSVALVCSGDASIYAMGALVMELLHRGDAANGVSAAARRAEVIVAPGVTALQAASARTGALIGHDFCAISLSDLLTPRDDILMRLRAAAEGDFVIAFYNPVSQRRRTLLAEARDILSARRPAETPVLLARNLGRAEERLDRRTLATLDVDEVDMLTVVLVGSSQSRAFETGDGGWRMFTPRGYAAKRSAQS